MSTVTSRGVVGNLHAGAELQALNITTPTPGIYVADFSIQSDALLVTLLATSVATSLDVSVVAFDQDSGLESPALLTFPTITGPTTNLVLQRSGTAPASLRLKAVAGSGGASFRVKVRAVNSGTSDTKILGSDNMRVTQTTVGVTPIVLIASSLLDRTGLVIKNWSVTQTLYIGESAAKADAAIGYPLAPRDAIAMDVSAGSQVWAVSDAAGADARVIEAGG